MTDTGKLRDHIFEIDRLDEPAWQLQLGERKLRELEFADVSRDPTRLAEMPQDTYEKLHGNKKYYSVVRRSHEFMNDWIAKESPGNVVLDYACGNGALALQAATAGAALSIGFDISSVSIHNARAAAAEDGVGNVVYFQGDAEDTRLPDESVDRIICSGVLHHLDLSFAYPEMRRILRPGGKIYAGEALDYNPAIKLYRRLTPQMRTEWEKAHILSLKDVKFASRFFDVTDIHYWHVVGYVGGKYPSLAQPLERIDKVLERIPLLNRMAWIFTFELTKPA